MMNARKLAISIKSQFCVTGRDTEVVALQAGLKERHQPVQEEEVWHSDGAGEHEHGQPGVHGDGQEGEEQLGQLNGQDLPKQDIQYKWRRI